MEPYQASKPIRPPMLGGLGAFSSLNALAPTYTSSPLAQLRMPPPIDRYTPGDTTRHGVKIWRASSTPARMYLDDCAGACYAHELQKPYWIIDEGVPLLLGVNPLFARGDVIEAHEFDDSFAFEAMRRRRLIERAQELGDLSARFRPIQLINWALRQHISVPKALLNLAAERGLDLIEPHNPIEALQYARVELARAEKKTAELGAQVDRLRAELLDSQADSEKLLSTLRANEALLNDALKMRQQAAVTPASTAKSESNTSKRASDAIRNYNSAAKIAFGLVKIHYGGTELGLPAVKIKAIEDDLRLIGIAVDDATLKKHLLRGSEQAANK